MRKLYAILTTLSAFTTYVIVASRKATKPGGVTWISAETDEQLTLDEAVALADKAEGERKLTPMYSVGESVMVVNPYSHEIAIVDVDLETPLYYEIQAVVYDADEATFRYELDGENEWYAEDWLDNPPYPHMAKSLTDESDITMARLMSEGGAKMGDDKTNFTQAERDRLSEALDKQAHDFLVDRCLAVLTHGNASERAEAERVLGELVDAKQKRKGTK